MSSCWSATMITTSVLSEEQWGTGWGKAGFFRIAYSEVGTYYSGRQSIRQFGALVHRSPPVVFSNITYLQLSRDK